jgi:Rieske Fe-S protein
MSVPALTRRSVLRGLAVVAGAAVAGFVVTRASGLADPKEPTAAANAYGPASKTSTEPLASLDDVPVGGGIVVDGASVVLTRDAGGTVHGLSATCTHQGCTVSSVEDGVIGCPCHGSTFNAKTGAPIAGPATRPLPEIPVTVRDNSVFLA